MVHALSARQARRRSRQRSGVNNCSVGARSCRDLSGGRFPGCIPENGSGVNYGESYDLAGFELFYTTFGAVW